MLVSPDIMPVCADYITMVARRLRVDKFVRLAQAGKSDRGRVGHKAAEQLMHLCI